MDESSMEATASANVAKAIKVARSWEQLVAAILTLLRAGGITRRLSLNVCIHVNSAGEIQGFLYFLHILIFPSSVLLGFSLLLSSAIIHHE